MLTDEDIRTARNQMNEYRYAFELLDRGLAPSDIDRKFGYESGTARREIVNYWRADKVLHGSRGGVLYG